jgi:hypothetical protein
MVNKLNEFGVFVEFSRIFLLEILIFKRLTARHFYKLFGVKGLVGILSTYFYITDHSTVLITIMLIVM